MIISGHKPSTDEGNPILFDIFHSNTHAGLCGLEAGYISCSGEGSGRGWHRNWLWCDYSVHYDIWRRMRGNGRRDETIIYTVIVFVFILQQTKSDDCRWLCRIVPGTVPTTIGLPLALPPSRDRLHQIAKHCDAAVISVFPARIGWYWLLRQCLSEVYCEKTDSQRFAIENPSTDNEANCLLATKDHVEDTEM